MQISFAVTTKLISAFVFDIQIVQCLYFLKPISSLQPSSVAVQPGLCETWSETPKSGFLTKWLIFPILYIDEPAEQSSHSFVQIEREAYPPPPSRVQLERTRGPADPEEDLDSGAGHRRAYSMPSERLEVERL